MPVRKKTAKQEEELLLSIGQSASYYARLNADGKAIDEEKKEKGAELKQSVISSGLYEMNGAHKELTVPLGDGKTDIFIQIQSATSVKTVDNIVDLLRAKLGKKAETYIMKVEVLQKNTLESLHSQGLIDENDILAWTNATTQEKLIVKVLDDKTKAKKGKNGE